MGGMATTAGDLLTREDLDRMPDDGNRYELIEGEIVMSASPVPRHQIAVTRLVVQLHQACPSDLLVSQAPFDVVLGEFTVVEPDVLVIDPAGLDDRAMNGAPALAVEVLSPSTRRRDLVQKKRLYEQAGVRAYWVIDVEREGVSLTAWELRDGAYVAVAAIAGDEAWTAQVPFEVTIVPSELER